MVVIGRRDAFDWCSVDVESVGVFAWADTAEYGLWMTSVTEGYGIRCAYWDIG